MQETRRSDLRSIATGSDCVGIANAGHEVEPGHRSRSSRPKLPRINPPRDLLPRRIVRLPQKPPVAVDPLPVPPGTRKSATPQTPPPRPAVLGQSETPESFSACRRTEPRCRTRASGFRSGRSGPRWDPRRWPTQISLQLSQPVLHRRRFLRLPVMTVLDREVRRSDPQTDQ